MPPLPVLPGLRVVRAMEKAGFEVVRIAEATTSYVTRMVAVPLSLCIGTRRCESVHCAGSCVTAD